MNNRTDAVVSEGDTRTSAGTWIFSPTKVKARALLKGAEGIEAIAALVDSDYTTVWRAFTARTRPLGETVLQWAEALDCDVKDLYDRVQP